MNDNYVSVDVYNDTCVPPTFTIAPVKPLPVILTISSGLNYVYVKRSTKAVADWS